MLHIHSKTFNPDVLYVFDAENVGPHYGREHSHDFFELSIIMKGDSFYVIDGETVHLSEKTVLLFNPGVEHFEFSQDGMRNIQIHIGLKHFNLDRFPRNFLPFESKIIHLGQYKDDFFETCEEIILELKERKPGHELIIKSLVYKLIVYLIRDEDTVTINRDLVSDEEESEKQSFVNDVQLYIENHYADDLTLNHLAESFFTTTATLSRLFKELTGDTPINYLIHYRLEKAKEYLEADQSMTVKEVAHSVGYDDPLYFSKLFKKHYGESPTFYANKNSIKESD